MNNMKKYIIGFKLFAILMLLLPACDSEILDKSPQDRYSETVVWADINLADAFLKDAYHALRHPMREMMLSAVTDETYFIHHYGSDTYLRGDMSSGNTGPWGSNWRYEHTSWWLFNGVQKLNVFISRIDGVADSYEGSEKEAIVQRANRMKGEALFLRAYAYTQMARMYGGLPIITEPFKVGDDYLSFERASFEETVNFISGQCDAAAALLGTKAEMEMGRANKSAALALKSRILLFAASDLTADGTAANKLVGYENPNRTALWTAAKNAAKAVMDMGDHSLADFGSTPEEVKAGYYDFFRAKTLAHPEVIWGKMFDRAVGERQWMNRWNGPNGLNAWGGNNPTQNLIDAYQMEDGTSFWDHFELVNSFYQRKATSSYPHESPYYNREPRFYASVLYDSAIWQPRYANLADQDPVGIYDRRLRRRIVGTEVFERFGLDTRQGPVENWNGGYTGYLMKKMLDHQSNTRDEHNNNVWIEFRYAEILMNYAEACIGLGEIGEATTLYQYDKESCCYA
jgi:starch-binding outer membrane protein, SusD/RagB family